jgi:hypothetical protein
MSFLNTISRNVKKTGDTLKRVMGKKTIVSTAGPKDVCEILDKTLEKASGAINSSGCRLEKSLKRGFVIPEKQDALANAFLDIINDCLKSMKANKSELCVAVFQHAGKMLVVIKDNSRPTGSAPGDPLIRASFKNGPDGLPLELLHTRTLFSQFGGVINVSSDPQQGRLFTIAFKKHYSYLN